MQNELKSVILSFGILLILGISLTSFQQSFSQTTKFTDANYDEFHFNPDSYLANPINITGKIFNTITPSGGYGSFQLYQLGNSERLLYVGYNINIHQNFRDDECVRVMGNTVGSISYTNLFGAERSSPSVLATSIQKIDCKDMVNPNSKIVNIEQTQEKDGILFTLHKVEFADDKTRAFLSIENTNTDEDDELSFYPLSDSKEIQGKNNLKQNIPSTKIAYPHPFHQVLKRRALLRLSLWIRI